MLITVFYNIFSRRNFNKLHLQFLDVEAILPFLHLPHNFACFLFFLCRTVTFFFERPKWYFEVKFERLVGHLFSPGLDCVGKVGLMTISVKMFIVCNIQIQNKTLSLREKTMIWPIYNFYLFLWKNCLSLYHQAAYSTVIICSIFENTDTLTTVSWHYIDYQSLW